MQRSNQVIEPTKFTGLADALQPIDDALRRIFSTSEEETRLQRTRRIMGSAIDDVSDEDLEIYITEIQYLIDAWFDEFERQAFDGVTLKQLIQE
ncbi:MAG: hypothetical protein V4702_00835 [Patescibacteria group bacterium]